MRALEHKQETYNKLNAVPLFAESFPHMMKQLARGHVWAWENNGTTTELTTEQIEYIEALEKRFAKYDLTVYAVLNDYSRVGFTDLHSSCYLYVSNEDDDIGEYSTGVYYAIADVYNHTWNLNDMGNVVIARCAAGGPKRIG